MSELTLHKRRVAYVERGTGPPLMLLHAGGSSGRQWEKVMLLLECHFRVVAPDLWGFGLTDGWPEEEDLTHDHQASLVSRVIEAVALGPVHLVGHSYGGATAVRLALKEKELVKAMVLIEPILTKLLRLVGEEEAFQEYFDMAQAFLGNAEAGRPEDAWQGFIDYRNGPGTWLSLSAKSKIRFVSDTESTVEAFQSNLNNTISLRELRDLSIPTLVMCGEKTTLPDRRVTEILREHIRNCQYTVIPGAEHMSPLSHPEFVATAIRQHVDSIGLEG
jgi:pimeloyl-ACP methyl ester carboxylesterase